MPKLDADNSPLSNVEVNNVFEIYLVTPDTSSWLSFSDKFPLLLQASSRKLTKCSRPAFFIPGKRLNLEWSELFWLQSRRTASPLKNHQVSIGPWPVQKKLSQPITGCPRYQWPVMFLGLRRPGRGTIYEILKNRHHWLFPFTWLNNLKFIEHITSNIFYTIYEYTLLPILPPLGLSSPGFPRNYPLPTLTKPLSRTNRFEYHISFRCTFEVHSQKTCIHIFSSCSYILYSRIKFLPWQCIVMLFTKLKRQSPENA